MSEPSNKLRTTLDILKGGASTDGGDVSVVVFTATDYCHASRALAALLADKLVAHVRFDVPLLESGDATLPLQEEQPSIDTGGGVAKANDTALVRSAGLSQEAMRYFEVDAVPAIIFVQRANPTLRVPPSIAPTALREATQALLAAVQLPQSGEPPLPSEAAPATTNGDPIAVDNTNVDSSSDSTAAVVPYIGPGAGWAKAAHVAYNEACDLTTAAAHFSAAVLAADAAAKTAVGDDVGMALAAAKDARYNLASLLLAVGRPLLAVAPLKLVVLADPNDATAHAALGSVCGDVEPAAVARAYASIVEATGKGTSESADGSCGGKGGGAARAAHMLATLTGEGASAECAAAEYVAEVFDELAPTFEQKLVGHLGYKVPWQLLTCVDATVGPLAKSRGWRIVDLGCGSGLCGRLFRKYVDLGSAAFAVNQASEKGFYESGPSFRGGLVSDVNKSTRAAAGRMVGVDLSPKMVAAAEAAGGYDELYVEDVHATLEREPSGGVDLLISADTFIYVGKLERCFSLAASRIPAAGYFAFSVETLDEEFSEKDRAAACEAGFRLRRSGRYAHSPAYIHALADKHGFTVKHEEEVTVRTEQATPVEGLVFLLERYSEPLATVDGVRTITLSDESAYPASTTAVASTSPTAVAAAASSKSPAYATTTASPAEAVEYTLTAAALCRVIGDCFAFIEEVTIRLEGAGFVLNQSDLPQQRRYEMDHICYRCATLEEYAQVCQALLGQGHQLLTESPIGGRPISTFELSSPITAAGFTVRCLEVPSPKDGSPYASGLEHAELVVSQSPSTFADDTEKRWAQEASVAGAAGKASHKPAGIQFDRHAALKASNPDVSVSLPGAPGRPFPSLTVKFHEKPIYKVIAEEQAAEASSASLTVD